jgi:hypothetical protein
MENNKSNGSGALLFEHVARILVRIYVQVYVHTVQPMLEIAFLNLVAQCPYALNALYCKITQACSDTLTAHVTLCKLQKI